MQLQELSGHIEKLLYTHDYVILPGFGGFVTRHVPAHIDSRNSILYPPGQSVAFNSRLTNDDGLLVKHVAEAGNLSISQASKTVRQHITQLKKQLKEEGSVELNHIGLLRVVDGSFSFEPYRNTLNFPESYGLEPVKINKVRSLPLAKKQVVKKKAGAGRSKNRYALAAVLIPFLLVSIGLGFWFGHSQIDKKASGLSGFFSGDAENERTTVENTETDIIYEHDHVPEQEHVKHASAQRIFGRSNDRNMVSGTAEAPDHHIIGGAFSNTNNARTLAVEFRNRGYDARVLDSDRALKRVAIATYSDINEAESTLEHIKNNYIPDAWILTE